MSNWYTLTVRFERYAPDEDEVAQANFPSLPLNRARIQQLTIELQEAYDQGLLSGHFKVISEPEELEEEGDVQNPRD